MSDLFTNPRLRPDGTVGANVFLGIKNKIDQENKTRLAAAIHSLVIAIKLRLNGIYVYGVVLVAGWRCQN